MSPRRCSPRAALCSALAARDEHAHAEHLRGRLTDDCISGRAVREHELLQRWHDRREDRRDARADREELRLEGRARVHLHGHRGLGDGRDGGQKVPWTLGEMISGR